MKRIVLALSLAAPAALAQTHDGDYALDGACGAMSDGRLTVSDGEIVFWESACALQPLSPIPELGNAVIYDITCTGEGESWTDRIVLMNESGGGLIMLRPGFVAEYARC